MQDSEDRLNTNNPEESAVSFEDTIDPSLIPSGFQFIEIIHSEGASLVYKARNQTLDQAVAIKILRADSGSQNPSASIVEEARLIANLSHRSIVKLLQVGVLAEGLAYLVYEYIDGNTLRSLLEQERLELQRVESIFQQILDALAYIHSSKLIHRDLKPENIIIDQSGNAKILDFGIARRFDDETGTYRTAGLDSIIKGTPLYMSPEQCQRKTLTSATDIYSVACILYECIAGHPPLQGESPLETIYKHTKEPPPELPDLRAGKDFQDRMQNLFQQVLDKEALNRPDASQFARNLQDSFSVRTAVESTGKPSTEEHISPIWIAIGIGALAVIVVVVAACFEHSMSISKTIKNYNRSGVENISEKRIAEASPKSVNGRIVRLATNYKTWQRSGSTVGDIELDHLLKELEQLRKEATRPEQVYAIEIWLGRIFRHSQRFEEAISHYKAALNLCKDKNGKKCLQAAQCYLQMGDNYLMIGNYKSAIENLLKAESFHRDFDENENRYYLLNIPENFQAMEPRGFMVRIHDELGTAYARIGELKKARQHLEFSRELWDKGDESIQFIEGKIRLLEVIYKLEGKENASKFIRKWEAEAIQYTKSFTHVRWRFNNLYTVQKFILAWCESHPDMKAEAALIKEHMKQTMKGSEFDSSILYKSAPAPSSLR